MKYLSGPIPILKLSEGGHQGAPQLIPTSQMRPARLAPVPLCLRIRFSLGPRLKIDSEEFQVPIGDPVEGKNALLRGQRDTPISDSKHLSLMVQPFDAKDDAERAADRWIGILKTAFAHVAIGADFGGRAPTSVATSAGLQMLEAQWNQRVLNDVHGVSIYECQPEPLFARGEVDFVVGKPLARVVASVDRAIERRVTMSSRERLSYDLFAASTNESSADARFVMLMMAVETLIDPAPRDLAVRSHVEDLIETTRSASLPKSEIQSVVGTLDWLRQESIGQAGRKLAATLGDRKYMDGSESSTQFFTRCYDLRSALVHGYDPRPSRETVGDRSASLERFVADLLSLEMGDAEQVA